MVIFFPHRLKDYPHYCQHLASIPHFMEFPPSLIEYIEYGQQSREPLLGGRNIQVNNKKGIFLGSYSSPFCRALHESCHWISIPSCRSSNIPSRFVLQKLVLSFGTDEPPISSNLYDWNILFLYLPSRATKAIKYALMGFYISHVEHKAAGVL